MKNKKQLLINIITIINVVIIAIFIYQMVINSIYSRKFAKELIEKNGNTSNYILSKEKYLIEKDTTEIEKVVQMEDARKIIYEDTGKVMLYYNDCEINEKLKRYSKTKATDNGEEEILITTKEIISMNPLKSQYESYNNIISSYRNYKYLGKEKIDSISCIIVKCTMDNKVDYIKVWINLDNGFVIKEESYKDNILESIVTYKTEVNTVTSDIVEIPNLDEYTYIEK